MWFISRLVGIIIEHEEVIVDVLYKSHVAEIFSIFKNSKLNLTKKYSNPSEMSEWRTEKVEVMDIRQLKWIDTVNPTWV